MFIDPSSGGIQGPEAMTASDGTYSIGQLSAGVYYLYFFYSCNTPFATNYAPVIWPNATNLFNAGAVTVNGDAVTNINAKLPVGGEITGHVADMSGQPLIRRPGHRRPVSDLPVLTTTTTSAAGKLHVKALRYRSVHRRILRVHGNSRLQHAGFSHAVGNRREHPPITGVNATFAATAGGGTGGGGGSSGGGGGGGVVVGAPATAITTSRIFGADAIATSIASSTVEFPSAASASALVLARSDRFADALAGGPLAASVHGPLLITPGAPISAGLDPRVLREIARVLAPAARSMYSVARAHSARQWTQPCNRPATK